MRAWKKRPPGHKGKRMDTDYRIFKDSTERLSALVLATVATFLLFAAINAGFPPL